MVTQSVIRRGNCWDNSVAGYFFKTLKIELIYDDNFKTIEQAKTSIFEYIEIWYNRIIQSNILLVTIQYTPHYGKSVREIPPKIGYLNAAYLTMADYDAIFKVWNTKKAIIFDLRNYPKENFLQLLPYLKNYPRTFVQLTHNNLVMLDYFTFLPHIDGVRKNISYSYNSKIIVLVNNISQSLSEFDA
ncbi:IS3 family transposase [Zhouia sp. PK063]|uniref:IS3 family transposase n=1 Tax=Zhouia sp. PK063 TaxID=3373602 RepID=UPI0037BA7374